MTGKNSKGGIMTKFASLLAVSVFLSGTHGSFADCGQFSVALTNLPSSADTGFQVNGLNSAGRLTGFYFGPAAPAGHAFVFNPGNLVDAGTLGGSFSEGLAINSSGWIAGRSKLIGDDVYHAMAFDGATMFDLGTLGGDNSIAYAINDAGQVAGNS